MPNLNKQQILAGAKLGAIIGASFGTGIGMLTGAAVNATYQGIDNIGIPAITTFYSRWGLAQPTPPSNNSYSYATAMLYGAAIGAVFFGVVGGASGASIKLLKQFSVFGKNISVSNPIAPPRKEVHHSSASSHALENRHKR